MTIIDRPSPNFNERQGGSGPDFLILHYTDMASSEAALARLCDPAAQVSAHYLVDEDGTVYRLVDEDKRAWHAGKSRWKDETDLNSRSIGIEIANPGHSGGYRDFPPAQMAAVTALCQDIMARRSIPADHVLAHSDIAPARKQDPGERFDWRGLAAEGVGVWPSPVQDDFTRASALARDEAALRAQLTAFGYAPDDDLQAVLTAFQRHFHPEIFATPEKVGAPDPITVARLCSLTRRNKGLLK